MIDLELGMQLTVALGMVLGLEFLLLEVVLRALAEIGNVRFQGLIDDHPGLMPALDSGRLHLSRVVNVLRLTQLLAALVAATALARLPFLSRAGVLAPLAVLVAMLIIGRLIALVGIGEDGLVRLLKVTGWPLMPVLSLVLHTDPAPTVDDDEDDDEEDEEVSEREMSAFLEMADAAGIFERSESRFVEALVEFFDTLSHEAMTPRLKMIAAPEGTDFAALVDVFVASEKSRVLLYGASVDEVSGYVHVKDLLAAIDRGETPSAASLVREIPHVRETTPLEEVLERLKSEKEQIALVLDEHGGTAGLITLTDVLEELVGELDELPAAPHAEDDGSFQLDGLAPVETLSELLGIDIPDDESFTTIGGLVFNRFGELPRPGDAVDAADLGLRFEVVAMHRQRLVKIRVQRLALEEIQHD